MQRGAAGGHSALRATAIAGMVEEVPQADRDEGAAHAMRQTLEIEELSKSFGQTRAGQIRALDGVSFDVRPGEIFGFVGSNGAGKSTTMRIVLGVLAADAGQVRFDGRPIDFDSRRTIGYMPEERGLYPKMKVGEQLEYLAQLHGLSPAQAKESVRRWTVRLGIDARLGDQVQALSLGNQQRVQLAAALVHDPAVLVLDEPFSGLDPVAVDVMSDVLREKAATGVPVIFSSHQLELVQQLCDRVGIIVAGRMRAVGTVEELRAAGNRRLELMAPAAPPSWADGLAGVTLVERDGGRFVLELDPPVDDQAVLHAALGTGPVRHFASYKPSLAELFREVVAA
jgi:ABC-2 type transport system ATP-binding protein